MNAVTLFTSVESIIGMVNIDIPPIHPILVNFTAALIPASVLSDVLGRIFKKESLSTAAWWMLLYGVVVTPLTVLAGWYWLRQMGGMDMAAMTIHKWLGTAMIGAFLGLALWRWHSYRQRSAPKWSYLAIATIVVGALVVQGHLGGTMSFGDEQTNHAAPTVGDSMPMPHGSADHSHSVPASNTSLEPQLQWSDHIDLKKE